MENFELEDLSDEMEMLANKIGFIGEVMDHLLEEAGNDLARESYKLREIIHGKGGGKNE